MNFTEKADDFLRQYGMHQDGFRFDDVKDMFIADMKAGLEGRPSSLKMIPTYLSADGPGCGDETAIAVDIGGTNLRIALTSFHGGTCRILSLEEFPVPGLTREITKAEFFGEITDRLQPVIRRSNNIGVCFSHAAEILPNRDGRLISFSKEIRVTGSEGMEITKELSLTLAEKGVRETKDYVLLNDTAAVLLGGAASAEGQGCLSHIGLVLGTGMNLCYAEKTQEIKKLKSSYRGAEMLVNTESGYFSGVPTGVFDTELDKTTANPGVDLLEKMTSGRYQGQLIFLAVRRLALDGLLTPETREAFSQLDELSLPEVSAFMADSHGRSRLAALCRSEADRDIVAAVADRLVLRAAKLTAVSVAAVIEKTGAGIRPDRPVCITAEGSTFYKLHSFRAKFESYLKPYFVRIISVDNATILGTAFAAIAN